MNSTAEDIKAMLEADATVQVDSATGCYPIHIGPEPPTPQEVVTIVETMGMPPQLTFDKTEKYEYPSVQIKVITNDYQNGWVLISAIKDSLHGRAHEMWNGALYTVIRCTGGPAFLEIDKNNRIRFVINFNIQRR